MMAYIKDCEFWICINTNNMQLFFLELDVNLLLPVTGLVLVAGGICLHFLGHFLYRLCAVALTLLPVPAHPIPTFYIIFL